MGHLKEEENENKHAQTDSMVVTYFSAMDEEKEDEPETEKKEKEKVKVMLNADAFIYDAIKKKYTVKLSGVKVVKWDLYRKTVTFEIDDNRIDEELSADPKDDELVDEVLDEIEKNENGN